MRLGCRPPQKTLLISALLRRGAPGMERAGVWHHSDLYSTSGSMSLTHSHLTYRQEGAFPFNNLNFVYFLTALGLHCSTSFFSLRCVGAAPHLPCVGFSLWWLLLWERALGRGGLSSCGHWALEHRLNSCTWACLFHGMWDLPESGIDPVSPQLAGRLFNTKAPGEPLRLCP